MSTDIGRCKTCAFVKEHKDKHRCTNEKISDFFGDHAMDGICYEHYEGGLFFVGPDFGCIHHKPRTETNPLPCTVMPSCKTCDNIPCENISDALKPRTGDAGKE